MKGNILFGATALAGLLLPLSVNAAAPVESRGLYSTNPSGGVGKAATITIDGKCNDWNESMLISQGAANDACIAFKGQHENCVTDLYSMYAAWDDTNLYIAWQMVNPADCWWRAGDGPLSDGGRVLDVPIALALSVKPGKNVGVSGRCNGAYIWTKLALQYDEHADYVLMMSGKVGLGTPAIFNAVDAEGNTDYSAAGCRPFSSLGITYKMGELFFPSKLLTYVNPASPEAVYSDAATVADVIDESSRSQYYSTPHDTKYDSFYEIAIPLSALGIDRAYLESTGIGARIVATRGESGIDCLPHDPCTLDNVFEDYGADSSTSGEKDDLDIITYHMASIGKLRDGGGDNPNPDPDPDPDPQPDPDPSDGTVCYKEGESVVFFEDTKSWGKVYVYLCTQSWGKLTGDWPGTACSLVKDNIYKYVVTASDAHWIIFSNGVGGAKGDSQTEDLAYTDHGYYKVSGKDHDVTTQCSSGVDDVAACGGAEFFTADGILYVDSPVATTYQVVSMNGQVTMIKVPAGMSQVTGLDRGVYVIEGVKVII